MHKYCVWVCFLHKYLHAAYTALHNRCTVIGLGYEFVSQCQWLKGMFDSSRKANGSFILHFNELKKPLCDAVVYHVSQDYDHLGFA